MPEKEVQQPEKSIDEKVGAVDKVADVVLSKVLERMQADGDTSHIDELIEDRYKPENYEKTLEKIARRRAGVAAEVKRISGVQDGGVGLAAWAVAKGIREKTFDPATHLAKAAGIAEGDGAEAAIHKNLGIATPQISKTLQISVAEAGGVLTTGDRVDDFFRPLRDDAIVLRFGPRTRGIVDGALTVTGLESDVSITWDGEVGSQEIKDEPTWGERNRPTNHARVLVPLSNASLRSRASAQILRDTNDSIRFAFAIGFDQAWINGTGASFRPKGLRAYAPDATASAGDGFDNIVTDAKGSMSRMSQNNVPMRNLGWLMSKREMVELMFLTDVNDRFPFRDEIMNGTWFGEQVQATNNVAINEGAGENESFVLLTDFSGVIIGIGTEVLINTYDQASYTVNGTIYNPVERGETVIAAESETLLLVAQSEYLDEIDEVTWGA